MEDLERIKQLKEKLNSKHVSFYTNELGKLKRYDMNSNEQWIRQNINPEWRNPNINAYISGFDFVSMSIVNVRPDWILWDSINGFYDTAPEWFRQCINRNEKIFELVPDSWKNYFGARTPKMFKIHNHSEKNKNSDLYSFEGGGLYIYNSLYKFDGEINGTHYEIIIPSDYINKHTNKFFNNQGFGLISKQDLLTYINECNNKVLVDNYQNNLINY